MYQGKYTKTDNNQRRASAPKAAEAAPVNDTPVTPEAQEAPRKPARNEPSRQEKRAAAKRKRGTKAFYTIYFACIILFFIVILCVMSPLRNWLVKYEASQPGHMRDQIFQELFADPDWEKIYTLAGVEDNAFENQSTFAAHMDALVGDTELTCLETSAGLSGDKKFIIKLGDEKIASFTLTGGAESDTEIPEWELGSVEVFFTGAESVIVEKLPGQTVYINGVALDDSYTIRTVTTSAENYLPEGTQGFRLEQQQVTGLLTTPQVSVKDASGNEVSVTYNEETGVYEQEFTQDTATTEEKELALNAMQTYAKYMIGKSTLGAVQKYFDTSSQFYDTIRRSEVGWMQSFASYVFTDAVYSDYYRYSDDLFSIKVDMDLNLTRHDGSIKTYELNNTLFFRKNTSGWKVMEATNVDVQARLEQVRLTFVSEDQVIESVFVDSDANSLTLPSVTAPEGKVFAGWVTEETDSNGNITLTVVFDATTGSEVYLPSGTTLEPMTLEALFEEAAGQ